MPDKLVLMPGQEAMVYRSTRSRSERIMVVGQDALRASQATDEVAHLGSRGCQLVCVVMAGSRQLIPCVGEAAD